MAREAAVIASDTMRAEKQAVARNSVIAAVVITALKFVVGMTTGSLGILSEAAHSGLDLVAAVITLLSVRVSDRPADEEHHFGHGKVENFSAFIETGLLLLTCAWIVWEAVRRLLGVHHVHIEPTVGAFVVMGLSVAVDWWRSRALARVAVKYDSQALHADALHFRTDIWSSGVVILGLALVVAGRVLGWEWLALADTVAALVMAGFVVSVSSSLARQTIDALLDAAPAGVRAQVIAEARRVPGVLDVDRARIRRAGNRHFVDLSIALARNVTFERSAELSRAVSDAVHRVLSEADVVVHPVPRAADRESLFDRVRAVAARRNIGVHDLSIQEVDGVLHLEQHLELEETVTLRDAHEAVTRLEHEIRAEIPEIGEILTHIESEPATIERGETVVHDRGLESRLERVAAEFEDVLDMHDLRIKRVRDRLYASCHCTFSDALPLGRVHDISTELETRFKQAAPGLFRVLIHPEPQADNRR
jgi:cation diffusion facilitator family transporter